MINLKLARKNIEEKIYKNMDIMDTTGANTEYYKSKFSQMNDNEFLDFFKQDFPIKFQTEMFKIDPKISTILKALKLLSVPSDEKVNMPFIYKNKNGVPVKSQKCSVVYLPLKRLKQMVQKKSGFSVDISKRDWRTGLLIDTDKNGNSTDREFESLGILRLPNTMKELSTYRADAMEAKSKFYNQINTTGIVSINDVPVKSDDSIARNLISTYLIGCHINSNLINKGDYLPRTLKRSSNKQTGVIRK